MKIAIQCSDKTWLSAIDGGGILAIHRGEPGDKETFNISSEGTKTIELSPTCADRTSCIGNSDDGSPLVWGKSKSYIRSADGLWNTRHDFEAGPPTDGMRTRIRIYSELRNAWKADGGWWGAEAGGGGVISTNRLTSDHHAWNYFTIRDMSIKRITPEEEAAMRRAKDMADRAKDMADRAASLLAKPPRGAGVGVGMDNNLYFNPVPQNTPNCSWTMVPNSGSVFAVAVWADRSVWGLGTNPKGGLWKRATLTSGWEPIGQGQFLAISAMQTDWKLLGVGSDNLLYTIYPDGRFDPVANSGKVIAVAAKADGSIWALGMDNTLYKRKTLNSDWEHLPGGGTFRAITAMPDGNLLAVGMDYSLFTIDGAGSWHQVPNSVAALTSLACYL